MPCCRNMMINCFVVMYLPFVCGDSVLGLCFIMHYTTEFLWDISDTTGLDLKSELRHSIHGELLGELPHRSAWVFWGGLGCFHGPIISLFM